MVAGSNKIMRRAHSGGMFGKAESLLKTQPTYDPNGTSDVVNRAR